MPDLEAEILLTLDSSSAVQAERVTERIQQNLDRAGENLSGELRESTVQARRLETEAGRVNREFDQTEQSVSDTKRELRDSLTDTRRLVGESRQLSNRMRDVAGESGRVERNINDIRMDRLTSEARNLERELSDVTGEAVRLDRILNSIGDELNRAERTDLENRLEESIREANRLESALGGVNRRLAIGSAAADQLGDNLAQAGRRASFGAGIGALGAGVAGAGGSGAAATAALAAPFVAAAGVIAPLAAATGPAIEAASALNEQIAQSEQIFGSAQPAIERFAESADEFGQSRLDAITLTNRFGGLLSNLGFNEGEIASTSQDLTQLSSDIASFRDRNPEDVGQALISGLSGETEPLKQLGIFLSDAEVRARALELGLADSTAEVDRAARSQAALSLILEQTSLAQGDFTRTSEGLANQTRITQATLENLLTDFGAQVEPAVGELLGAFNDELLPALEEFAQEAGPEFADFIRDVTPALITFGEVAIDAGQFAVTFLDDIAGAIGFAADGLERAVDLGERAGNFFRGRGGNTNDELVSSQTDFDSLNEAEDFLERVQEFREIANQAESVGVNIFDFTESGSGDARVFFEENEQALEALLSAIDQAEGVQVAIAQAAENGTGFFGDISQDVQRFSELTAIVEEFGDSAIASFGSAADALNGIGDEQSLAEFREALAERTRLAAQFPALLEEAASQGLANVVATALEAGAEEGSRFIEEVLVSGDAIQIDADIGEFNSKVSEAEAALGRLDETEVNPEVDPLTGEALNELGVVDSELNSLSETTATPLVDPETDRALSELNNVEGELVVIDSQIASPTVNIVDNASAGIDALTRRLNGIERDILISFDAGSLGALGAFGGARAFGGMTEKAGLYAMSEFNHPEMVLSSIAPVSKQIADLQRYQQRTGIPIIERAAEAQARNDHGTSVAELKTELAAAIREVMGITVNVDNNGDMRRAFRLAQRQMRRDRDQVSAVRAGFTA